MNRLIRWTFYFAVTVSTLLLVSACLLWVLSYRFRLDVGRSAYDRRSHDVRYLDLVTTPGCLNLIWISSPSGVRPDGRDVWDNVPPQYTRRADPAEASWDAEVPVVSTETSFLRSLHFAFARDTNVAGDESSGSGQPGPQRPMRTVVVCVPAWAPAALLLPAPLIAGARWLRRRRRRGRIRAGRCANCGYDLRATPGQCPECGSEQEAKHIA